MITLPVVISSFSVYLFINGLVTPVIWFAGAGLAWWRKRWAVFAGMCGAGLVGVVSAVLYAGGEVSPTLMDIAGFARAPVVGLLVAGFIAAQPRRVPRPPKWRL